MRMKRGRNGSGWAIRVVIGIVLVAFMAKIAIALSGPGQIGFDAQRWQDVARNVLAGGTPYVDAPDNKPPLWLLLAVIGEWTGAYAVFMLSIVAISNAGIVRLVYSTVREFSAPIPAVVSALVAAELLISSTLFINNKSLAVVLALGVVWLKRPGGAGVLAGVAAAVAQHAGAIVPLMAVHRWRTGAWKFESAVAFAGVSIAVFAAQYLAIGVIWGGEALVAAVDQSVKSVLPYLSGGGQFPNRGVVSNDPQGMLVARARFVFQHVVVFTGALIGGVWAMRRGEFEEKFWVTWSLVFGAMLAVSSFSHYIALSTPGIAVLTGFAVAALRGESWFGLVD